MIQKNLRIRILFGYIILMAVIGILIHERQRMQEVGTEATRVRKKPLQTSLAGANPNSYSTNHSSPGFSSSFFARVARAFEMAF
jgi:hypothetical protein